MLFDLEKLFSSNGLYVTANLAIGNSGPLLANYEEALQAEYAAQQEETTDSLVMKMNLIGSILRQNDGINASEETTKKIYALIS